MTRDVLNTES